MVFYGTTAYTLMNLFASNVWWKRLRVQAIFQFFKFYFYPIVLKASWDWQQRFFFQNNLWKLIDKMLNIWKCSLSKWSIFLIKNTASVKMFITKQFHSEYYHFKPEATKNVLSRKLEFRKHIFRSYQNFRRKYQMSVLKFTSVIKKREMATATATRERKIRNSFAVKINPLMMVITMVKEGKKVWNFCQEKKMIQFSFGNIWVSWTLIEIDKLLWERF